MNAISIVFTEIKIYRTSYMSKTFKERMQQEQRRKKMKVVIVVMSLLWICSVLLCPFIQASSLYYNIKLCVHNFTFYNLKNNDNVCYVWHEVEGRLSSNEYASIICFMQNKARVKHNETVILFSNGCTYQNCNRNLANSLLYLAIYLNIFK